jgi:hypothetical protein
MCLAKKSSVLSVACNPETNTIVAGTELVSSQLVGLRVDNRVTVVLVLGLERHIDTMIDNSEPRIRIEIYVSSEEIVCSVCGL